MLIRALPCSILHLSAKTKLAEEFASIALCRVENDFSGKKKEEGLFVAPEINACWYVFSFL